MITIENALRADPRITDYKINTNKKDSYELFFVKGKLETVRCTDTCDTEVTVYAAHDDFLGDAQFFVYPSTTEAQLAESISEAVTKALLINNQSYTLPGKEEGTYEVASNFADSTPEELAAKVANTVFAANDVENGSLNSVEVFINKHTDTVVNSRGLNKTQVRYSAMVEAIPTYNGETQSVELYEQYNFSSLDVQELDGEIRTMMEAAKARYEAIKPDFAMDCKVILGKLELETLFRSITQNLMYSAVYSHASIFSKGDMVQKEPAGDRITITMAGQAEGCANSSRFDDDGLTLEQAVIVKDGQAVGYFGANRYAQYLGETPTGRMRCMKVDAGSAAANAFTEGPYLEVVSMSGLQVDFFRDYIGGEIRLAYYHDGRKRIPVTGISISGSVSQVLNTILLSTKIGSHDSYVGPEKAILTGMKIF